MPKFSYDKDKVRHLIEEGQIVELDNEVEIEDLLLSVSESEATLDFLKALKKKRVDQIDAEAEKITENIDFLRAIIQKTLEGHNQKTRKFPGIGTVTKKKAGGGYVCSDESTLEAFLAGRGELENASKIIRKFDKKYLASMYESLDKTDELPAFVTKVDSREIISISFDKEFKAASDKSTTTHHDGLVGGGNSLESVDKIDTQDLDGINF